MELNRNKLIFFIITGGIIFLLIISLFFLRGDVNKSKKTSKNTNPADFSIWTIGPKDTNFSNLISDFKAQYKNYNQKNINIEVFSDFEAYYYALSSSFSSGNGPDVFVLNNNETSVFSDAIYRILPETITPNDFRKKYKPIFAQDLIIKQDDDSEFILGVPVGYETLGVFYNKRYVRSTDLSTISSLLAKIQNIKETNSNFIPLGIGNGTTVKYSHDIATQFMMLEDTPSNSLYKLEDKVSKDGLSNYLNYGYEVSKNSYNDYYNELKTNSRDASYLFANGKAAMIVGYPRYLQDIIKNTTSRSPNLSNFLAVEPFPHYTPGQGKTLLNYNYFVLNKYTKDTKLGLDFMKYLSSDVGAKKYLEADKYKLPALVSLEEDIDTKKIHKDYNIVISNFYDNKYELSGFDKAIKNMYDRELKLILDSGVNFQTPFKNFKAKLICISNKAKNLTGLSISCD